MLYLLLDFEIKNSVLSLQLRKRKVTTAVLTELGSCVTTCQMVNFAPTHPTRVMPCSLVLRVAVAITQMQVCDLMPNGTRRRHVRPDVRQAAIGQFPNVRKPFDDPIQVCLSQMACQ